MTNIKATRSGNRRKPPGPKIGLIVEGEAEFFALSRARDYFQG